MIENDTLAALKVLDSRMRQLLEVARLQAGRIVELRERVVKLQAAGAVNADGIAALGAKMLAALPGSRDSSEAGTHETVQEMRRD